MNVCKRKHRYDEAFNSLPESQKFYNLKDRHKCAGCAYDQGFNDAKSGAPPKPRLAILDKSQAGTVRHKDPILAYELGYRMGSTP